MPILVTDYSHDIAELEEVNGDVQTWLRLNAEISNSLLIVMTSVRDTLDELHKDIEETDLSKVLATLQQIKLNTAPD